uniref:Uncharacterized protein n=1 Tax=Leersia perrieri TaxID=77586 RepID=A0A0D9XDF4_9ORYZ
MAPGGSTSTYMQSKWLCTSECATAVVSYPVTVSSPEKQTKFRASMLSFDFARTAVEPHA